MPTHIGGPYYAGVRGNQVQLQEEMQPDFYGRDRRHLGNWRVDDEAMSPFWPGGGRLLGDSQPLLVAPLDYTPRSGDVGGNGTMGFSGVARDGNNTPVGGMTVRLYRTSDSLFVGSVVSNADGSYIISSPYVGQDHFVVCHKAGSPELAGASQTTMQPW